MEESTSQEFNEYLKKRGITRKLTISFNSEQNRVVDRRNRTLLNTARCLMMDAGLPASFCAEAVNTANYSPNHSPSRSLNERTPYELWTAKVPDVSYFRVFGTWVFYLGREPRKVKFDSRGRKGIFLGYAEENQGYRIWSPGGRKVVINRVVRFVVENNRHLEDFNDFAPKEQPEERNDYKERNDTGEQNEFEEWNDMEDPSGIQHFVDVLPNPVIKDKDHPG